jgi:hypothetical protein
MRLGEADTSKVSDRVPAGGGARIFISASSRDLAVSEKIGSIFGECWLQSNPGL